MSQPLIGSWHGWTPRSLATTRSGCAEKLGATSQLGVFAEVPLIVDTSALAIWKNTPQPARDRFRNAALARELRISPVVLLEFLHDAYGRAEFDARHQRFAAFEQVPLDHADGSAAIRALYDLAHIEPEKTGYHKVATPDALIAASAVREGCGVLHYDHDYERLAEVMPLIEVSFVPFGSV
jgi:predicted nucleic acid-binding protein